ncbi:glutathione S-transferase [Faunimonas pinastri]|uniref:Glutathione S-transferase n=1 Tax=Faunimonas pinastri TaxID=1855383 RepID=A0A1H9P0U5_9HYPH|nr:glutathione binding-like protein [Faunimonas pinastri]SER41741.1 glutathione S-transferase [Faunimonas pinastri]
MKLYYSPAMSSLSEHIAILETGIECDLEKVDMKSKTTEDGRDFREINPKGQVPALLLDDGSVLTENAAVLQFIGDRAGREDLVPNPGTIERARFQEWLSFIGMELHKNASWGLRAGDNQEIKQKARTLLEERLGNMEKLLGERDFLVGEDFTLADCYGFFALRIMGKLDITLDRWPALKSYHDRVAARPHVREAMQAEGL